MSAQNQRRQRARTTLSRDATVGICPWCLNSGAAQEADGRLVPCHCGQPVVEVGRG